MKRRRTPEERYKYILRTQRKALEEFAEYEFGWSKDLLLWYQAKNEEMPEDIYRACAFFQNREYRNKRGSLTLLYRMNKKCEKELPIVTKENAFDILKFKYLMYAKVLLTGGF